MTIGSSRDRDGATESSMAARTRAAVHVWRARRAERCAARAAVRSLAPLHRLLTGSGRRLGPHRRDPMSVLTEQLGAIVAGREELAGFHDPAVDELAQQWGRALAEAIVLSAAADAQRRGKPVRDRARPVDDSHWHSADRQLQLASALNMLRSVRLELDDKPWPAARFGMAVTDMDSGP